MNFKKYCRCCGSVVDEGVGPNSTPPPYVCCKGTLGPGEVISGWKRDARVTQLKAMHKLMAGANDEEIYMTWIYRMPDCPSEEDFIDIALNDEEYHACFDLFVKLIAKEGNRW